MKRSSVLFAAFLGCAGVASARVPANEPYHASGTEPFWGVGIVGGRIIFEMHEETISAPAPEPRATPTGRRYVTRRLTVDIRPEICNDGMSDYLYADTVIVVADGRTLNGCGGERVPEDTLANSRWSIEQIDGRTIDQDEAYVIAFTADRISGRAGCNRFSGTYSRSGNTLTSGALATTRMACPGPRMEHERRALQVLSGPVRISRAGDSDALILTGNGGSLRIYRTWAPWPSL
jgi:heat shock protein HslJ